jgi:hypothetical protein
MSHSNHKPLVTLYAALLHLYPANFRRQFAAEMLDTFNDLLHHHGPLLASSTVLRELPPTLLREHLDDPTTLSHVLRLIFSPLPAIALYIAALTRIQKIEELFVFTCWTLSILAALYLTRCRGLDCLLHTTLASILGLLLPLAFINTWQPMHPGLISLAPPLTILALTVGLILSSYARLIMEGFAFTSSSKAAT